MIGLFLALAASGVGAAPPVQPEDLALRYLAREVPRWAKENHCYSCHNNGDAARVLYRATRLGWPVPAAAMADTTRWLEHPEKWDKNGGEGPYSDKKLAALQFAASLAEAHRAGLAKDPHALDLAARRVIAEQAKDGSWTVVSADTLGSPVTHGTALATSLAVSVLRQIGGERSGQAVARADRWLRNVPVDGVLDSAAVLIGLGRARDKEALAQKSRCLTLIRKGEARTAGWGPFVRTAPEVFDTSVVLIALASQEPTAEIKAWIKRGRAYLLSEQQKDGSWIETTRPAGAVSYAQRLSTTAWATMALLASRGP